MRKVSKQQREKNKVKVDNTAAMHMWFLDIWKNLNPKECWNCGKYLGKEPLSLFFDHLLEKSRRPDLMMNIDNIFICCGDCHANKTNGFPGKIHLEAINKAKEMFNG